MHFEKMLNVIDSHAAGGPARLIISGLPYIPGKTMMEKCEYCSKNFSHLSDALGKMPRGQVNYIAALTTPTTDDADFGCTWIMPSFEKARLFCGHATICVITSLVEIGLVEAKEPVTELKLDFPLGRVKGYAHIRDGVVEFATARLSWGSFAQGSFAIHLPKIGSIPVNIGFSGRYFAFMHSKDIGVKVRLENLPRLIAVATEAMPLIKDKMEESRMQHPEWRDMICYNIIIEDEPTLTGADHKNATLRPPSHHFDFTPCGSGTCANMAILHSKGELKLKQKWVNENLMGNATFTGRLVSKTKVGHYDAVIPELTGRAYITSMSTVVINSRDPFKYGFKQLRDTKLAKLIHGDF